MKSSQDHMVRRSTSVLALFLLTFAGHAHAGSHAFQYLAPKPGSLMVSPLNNIVIRHGELIDAASLREDLLLVVGSRSGSHAGEFFLSDDQKTLIFRPDEMFLHSEKVTVTLTEGLRSASGAMIPPVTFSFTIRRTEPVGKPGHSVLDEVMRRTTEGSLPHTVKPPSRSPELLITGCDSLPASYPSITIDILDNPNPGEIFISPFYFTEEGHLIILDNSGVPLFYRRIPFRSLDFKPQPDGRLTYFPIGDPRFIALDSSYAVVDSFLCGNGYETDGHELTILDNGHALLMSYDYQTINMDSLVVGGDTAATVIGLVIQELDTEKNVVFQWLSWDHISILDGAVSGYVVLDSSFIDYIHGNAIELDDDGNLLVSSRHINEITKIDRQTGDIIWRLGLNAVNNDFTFTNDVRGWSHQHDIRRLENGHISLYDNGNFLDPEYSSALEYALDEQNMTATLVWAHRNNPDVYGPFMGSVRQLASGGALIGWGGTAADVPDVTEVHADGSTALELSFPDNHYSYRAFRAPWRTSMFTLNTDSVFFATVSPGDSSLQSLIVTNGSTEVVEINCFANSDSSFSVLSDFPITIPPSSSIGITLKFNPSVNGEFLDRLYVRSVNDTQLVAQVAILSGRTDSLTASVDDGENVPVEYYLSESYPNPFNATANVEFGIAQFGHVAVVIYDLLGRKVATLVDEKLDAGIYRRQWDATSQPSSVYFLRLSTPGYSETRKLVLLK